MAVEYDSLAKISRAISRNDDAARWKQKYEVLRAAIDDLLWDGEDRFYYDLDEAGEFVPLKTTAGLLPLLAGVPDRDKAEALRMHMMNPSEFWKPCPLPSVSVDEEPFASDLWCGTMRVEMNLLVYHGLKRYGFLEEAIELARRTVNEVVNRYLSAGCLYECYDATADGPPAAMPRLGVSGDAGRAAVHTDVPGAAAAFLHLLSEVR